MGDILKKIVKVESASFEEKFVKLKADGQTYRIWYVKKDGSLTKAGVDYETLPRQGVGSTLEISYTEQHNEYNGNQITYRHIIGIKQATKTHHENQHSPQRPESRGYRATKEGSPQASPNADKPDWNEINLGKCRHAFLLLAFKQGSALEQSVVDSCNDWAYASMYGRLKADQGQTDEPPPYEPGEVPPEDDIMF